MRREHEKLLMLALGDELAPDQKAEFERLLAADAGFRSEWEGLRRTRQWLDGAAAASFEPYFATRVMARIGQRQESVAEGLVRLFWPLVPATVALALVLSVVNWRAGDLMGEGASTLEVAFGMPAVSVEAADLLDL